MSATDRQTAATRPVTVTSPLPLDRPLIVGFGITGKAVAEALIRRGHQPAVVDDAANPDALAAAEILGVELHQHPSPERLLHLVDRASALLPSPGLPDNHPVFALAAEHGVPVLSEFDLAHAWDKRPMAAITGTNGKTTVTMMVTEVLNRSGLVAEAVGNTEVPLVAALDHGETEVFVVEASSFRLGHSARFSPRVAVWLNFAPDHLDAHRDLECYEEAKASIWSHLDPGAVAVANADDPVVMTHLGRARRSGADIRLFSLVRRRSDDLAVGVEPNDVPALDGAEPGDEIWYPDWQRGSLVGPDGPFMAIDELIRRQPHDVANALACAVISTAAGASISAVVDTLRTFAGLPHRLELVGERDGVRWFNDSKATVPHATVAAMAGFESVVLIAGGKNKGLSLDTLAHTVPPVRSVVAIGHATPEIAAVFEGLVPVEQAESMSEAVAAARRLSRRGDVVVLSPSCTSFDWYANYVQRGQDFTELVRQEVLNQ